MSSLRQLLAAHPVVLLLDTASARVQIGLWTRGEATPPLWRTSDTEASSGLFECVDALLREASLRIADARRDTWHVARLGEPLRRVPSTELSGECVMPEYFRHWTPLPAALATTSYDLAALLPALAEADVFRATTEPDAFSHEEPTYVTWSPQVHQAPAPRAS